MLQVRRVLETAIYCEEEALRIPVESRVDWALGGHSIYFRDPDGRSVELATPGTWPCY
jgi:catechol 2,3-dioxygenase-like lactoylglutathione lyase family enzyme